MATTAPRSRAIRAPAVAAPAPAAPAPTRSRARALSLTPAAPEAVVQPVATPVVQVAGQINDTQRGQLNDQLAAWNESNIEKNRHARGEKAAATTTEKLLRDWGLTSFTYSATFGGKTRTIEAKIGAKVGERLNMQKLRQLVDDETFMKIVSATKDAVVDNAGTNVLVQITETVTFSDQFSIKAAK